MKSEQKKRSSAYCRNAFVRLLFGAKRNMSRRITSAAFALLLIVSAVTAAVYLNMGDRVADVSAGSVSESDCEADFASDGEENTDPAYGHLFIDSDPDGIIEHEGYSAEFVDYCHLSFELYPDGSGKDRSVTLYGMMPEGASAEAIDVTPSYPDPEAVSDEVSDDASVIAAYNITITDGENEYQPDADRLVRVEITDPQISREGITEIWHISDDGTRQQITDVTVSDGVIGFFATGFSVYAIVNAPETYVPPYYDPVTSTADLTVKRAGRGLYLSYITSDGKEKYFVNGINSKNFLKETEDVTATSKWFLEKEEGHYKIYCYVKGVKKYIYTVTGNEIGLGDTADPIAISPAATENTFLFKHENENKWLQHSGSGGGIRYWSDYNNAYNSRIHIYFSEYETTSDDYYEFDGKTYGLMNYIIGTEGNALMANEAANYLSMMTLVVRSNEERNTLYVAEDSDISMWTFHLVYGDRYKLSADVNGTQKYLKIGDELTLTDESNASAVKVYPKDGMVRLSDGDNCVSFTGSGFISDSNPNDEPNQWLYLVELSGLSEKDYVTYSADKISVSDTPDGSSVIVYTRVWNDVTKGYEFYAVDHNGKLYPCYERGNNIMWVGTQINTLLWNFIEYHYNDGSQNYYYELYNPYSHKFIAPQLRDAQILSDTKIGINLPGRRENQYYTDILAWDNDYYAFAGIRADITDDIIHATARRQAPFILPR